MQTPAHVFMAEKQNARCSFRCQPDQKRESDKKSYASDTLQQDVEIQGGAVPEIQCMRLQKDLRGPSPLIVQQGEEFPFRVELGGSAKLGQHLAYPPSFGQNVRRRFARFASVAAAPLPRSGAQPRFSNALRTAAGSKLTIPTKQKWALRAQGSPQAAQSALAVLAAAGRSGRWRSALRWLGGRATGIAAG